MCHKRYSSFLMPPCVLCSYGVDCSDVIDLRTPVVRRRNAIALAELRCDWRWYIANNFTPPSWRVAQRLISEGYAGMLVQSFARGATAANQNLVIWKWSNRAPHQVNVFDPTGRLPRNQSSWTD
jgi:RES domain-containing protein